MKITRKFFLRTALFTLASSLLIIGYGFWQMAAWALALWPWPNNPFCHLFIPSMLLAEGATMTLVFTMMGLNAVRDGLLRIIQERYPFESI